MSVVNDVLQYFNFEAKYKCKRYYNALKIKISKKHLQQITMANLCLIMASNIKTNEAKRDVIVNLQCCARLVSRQQKWWVRTDKCFYGEILKSKLQKMFGTNDSDY